MRDRIPARKRACIICGYVFTPYECLACSNGHLKLIVCPACHWCRVHADHATVHERACSLCGCRFLPRRCVVPGCGQKLSSICTVCHEEQAHGGFLAAHEIDALITPTEQA